MCSTGRSRGVSVTTSVVLGTVIWSINLTLVSFPRIRDQLGLRSCRLSQAIARNLEISSGLKKIPSPFPLLSFPKVGS